MTGSSSNGTSLQLKGLSRICIMGASASGKSALARQIGAQLGLPVIHLDQEYFLPNWEEPSMEDFLPKIKKICAEDAWLIEGNYSRTFDYRLPRADLIIFLDRPTYLLLYRAIKRVVVNYGKVRVDMAPKCPERFDFGFIHWVLVWNWVKRAKTLSKIKKYDVGEKLIVLKNQSEIDSFVASIGN